MAPDTRHYNHILETTFSPISSIYQYIGNVQWHYIKLYGNYTDLFLAMPVFNFSGVFCFAVSSADKIFSWMGKVLFLDLPGIC